MLPQIVSFGNQTFASLRIRNYRLYFIGQAFSQCGNWMQTVGLGWLVLQITNSGTVLGTVLAFQYLPLLVGGPFGGMLADRFDKRRILYFTQSMLAALALSLSILVYAGTIHIWMLYLLALLIGAGMAIDNPTRQTFVHDMVGREYLRNAVTLNSTEANLARAIGPLFAGVLIATVGIAFCFLVNALSFLALIALLGFMRSGEMHTEHLDEPAAQSLTAVLPYIASMPVIRNVLITMGFIGTLSYEFHVSLPLLAQHTFLGTAADYAALLAAMGMGSVVGGLFSASRLEVAPREFVISAVLFGVSMCATALMPTLGLATVGMIFVGFFSIILTSVGNTIIQLEAAPHLRARVMSLWSMAIFGSTLLGAPIIGFIGQYANPRWALAAGGMAAIIGGIFAARRMLEDVHLFSIPAFIDIGRQEATASDPKI